MSAMRHNYANSVQSSTRKVRYNSLPPQKSLRYMGGMKLRLKELRTSKGWTQRQAAEAAGMSVSYYADMERGDKQSNAARQEALARAFGVTVPDLFEATKSPEDEKFFLDVNDLSEDEKQILRDMAARLAESRRQNL
jgi:transcriptional regulator with XRE-family HTH domain